MEYYYFWLILFAFFAYFIITDNSISKASYLIVKIVQSKYEMTKWWLMNNPSNPLVKYLIWRRSMKLAKELQEQFDKKSK